MDKISITEGMVSTLKKRLDVLFENMTNEELADKANTDLQAYLEKDIRPALSSLTSKQKIDLLTQLSLLNRLNLCALFNDKNENAEWNTLFKIASLIPQITPLLKLLKSDSDEFRKTYATHAPTINTALASISTNPAREVLIKALPSDLRSNLLFLITDPTETSKWQPLLSSRTDAAAAAPELADSKARADEAEAKRRADADAAKAAAEAEAKRRADADAAKAAAEAEAKRRADADAAKATAEAEAKRRADADAAKAAEAEAKRRADAVVASRQALERKVRDDQERADRERQAAEQKVRDDAQAAAQQAATALAQKIAAEAAKADAERIENARATAEITRQQVAAAVAAALVLAEQERAAAAAAHTSRIEEIKRVAAAHGF